MTGVPLILAAVATFDHCPALRSTGVDGVVAAG
jgi:hypothetical protein